jgi:dTDP-4-amino-4,6-dideoxygalactose transaminase
MAHYNSWPLGKLPSEWQRPEPALIRDLGYSWDDPRDIVDIFEKKLAAFSGSKYAVVTDCCTNAIFLSLKYLRAEGSATIPKHTYTSVPMQLIHAGLAPRFDDIMWSGLYEIGDTGVVDGAGRFTEGMYFGKDSLHTLSFQIKKRLPIGRGGAILTDSKDAYEWLKFASYDGRNLNSPYDSPNHVQMVGWHYYMTPEDAARGIWLMDQLPKDMPDTMAWENYPDLSKMSVFSQYVR